MTFLFIIVVVNSKNKSPYINKDKIAYLAI
jgi:hypothetical protein